MDHALIAALAYGTITTVGGLILAAKLATTRQELEDRNETVVELNDAIAERNFELALSREAAGEMLAELSDHRAERERRLAPLAAANAARKAAAQANSH